MKKSIHEKNNILVRDLCKQFDEFLLDHVSFQVPKVLAKTGQARVRPLT